MAGKAHLQIKALLLIYLTIFVYAEESIQRMTRRTLPGPRTAIREEKTKEVLPRQQADSRDAPVPGTTFTSSMIEVQSESNSSLPQVTTLLIPNDGTEGCDSHLYEIYAQIDGALFQLITPNGTTLCNLSQTDDVALQQLYPNMTLHGRQIPNPVIIKYSVTILTDTVISGTVTLFALGTVAALALTIFILWYGAKKLVDTGAEQIGASKRAALPESMVPVHYRTRSRMPPVARTPKQVWVTYNDRTTDIQSADNEQADRDMSITHSCMKQVASRSLGNVGRVCCQVDMVGSEGYDYVSQIGISVDEATDFCS